MNPNVTPETQFVGQPAPEVPPQPSIAGIASAQTPEQPFTITGPAQPIQQEAPAPPPIPEQFIQHPAPPATETPVAPQFVQEAQATQPQPTPEAPKTPNFSPPEAQFVQPQPIPEVAPAPQPYPSPETQVSNPMAQNLGPDVAIEQAQAAAAMAIPDAPLLNNSGGELKTAVDAVVVGIDPNAETSAESKDSNTGKRITNSLAFAQSAWEKAGKNTDPDYTKAAHAAIQGALEKDLTAILGQEWKAPEPEETWS